MLLTHGRGGDGGLGDGEGLGLVRSGLDALNDADQLGVAVLHDGLSGNGSALQKAA